MISKISLLSACCLVSFFATAQNPVPVTQTPVVAQPSYAYKKLNNNLEYAFIIDKPTTTHPQEGDQITVNMQSVFNNTPMFNTFVAFKGKPAVYSVNKPNFKGDFIEAIMLMTPGDSIVCRVDADALYKNTKNKKPDYMKPGDKILYFVKLVSVKTKEQLQKEQQDAIMKQIKEQEAKQKAAAAKQLVKDDKILKNYFALHKITPSKTASGLYYSIQEEGSGEPAIPGDTVFMKYTGTLLDGTKFDSNEDTVFHSAYPLIFLLGRGNVIKGWDEGIALLKTGSKATFYIPSPLAYGPQSRPGSAANPKGIPPNSILLFDVQLLNSKHPVPVTLPVSKPDTVATPVKQL